MFKLSILLIFILNWKSLFFKVLCFKPKPSEPNNKTFFPFHLFSVKSFFADTSKALTQKFFDFKYLSEVLIFDTLKIFICSAPPLALL